MAPSFLIRRVLSKVRIWARFTIDGCVNPPSCRSKTTVTGYFLIVDVIRWLSSRSFAAQRVHRIDLRRPARGNVAGHPCHDGQ